MLKIIIQLITPLITFFAGFFKELYKSKVWKISIVSILIIIIYIINLSLSIKDEKNKVKKERSLMEEIAKISQENTSQKLKIDDLLGKNKVIESKIDEQTKEIKRLCDLLAKIMDRELKPTKSYAEAKNSFDSAIELMTQGDNKAAAEKFLEVREIAVKEQAYESAAISSSLASFRFEEIGEKQKAAKLQSEAGKFLMKLK
jgi:hypothetical protein